MAQFHLKFEAEDLAPHVMLVGNPQRAEQVSKLLQGVRLVNEYRYLLVFTGMYEGVRLSVATTGMGAPSTAIVVEELCNLGARVLVRVGSAGGIASDVDAGRAGRRPSSPHHGSSPGGCSDCEARSRHQR